MILLPLIATQTTSFRPPAVPLIAHDPYFSVWSTTDRLTDGTTRHWTGAEQAIQSLVRVDGQPFRLMGAAPATVPAMNQKSVKVTPTRTIYTFGSAETEIQLTFTTPTLPDDLDVLSRPATYVTWTARTLDGRPHDIAVYFDAAGTLAVDRPNQNIVWKREKIGALNALSIGSESQRVLARRGDDLRIDWGHLYVVGETAGYLGADGANRFAEAGVLPADQPSRATPAASGVSASMVLSLGKVGTKPVEKHVVVAYDDEYSIQYFKRNLRPYWRRSGMGAAEMLQTAERDYAKLVARCAAFDARLTADLRKAGGEKYADVATLAYRQAIAAQKVVADLNGQPLMFSKENFSNGCIGTVDVLYPAAPQLLLLSPALTKASLAPIMEYAASPRWKFPFAPHDLGQYPLANGQVYGGGERTEDNQMPVEESGNMLLLLAALAKVEGNANFAGRYWPQLEKWAVYLADKGFDPESQLSTDDFAGHLAHNVNLSAKAILALGAYAQLAEMRGLKAEAAKYHTLAKGFADRWVVEAADGDHFKLAFDKPGTWSQKYNLVWDRLLGMNLFPASVARKEMDFYRSKVNAFGLPLDSREDYTKLDWIVWTATLTGNRGDFDAMVEPIWKFLNETPDRVPMTDWYFTSRPRHRGFQARSVVGGVFIKLLENMGVWKGYAKQGNQPVGPWSPIPQPPVFTEVVPTGAKRAVEWSYTLNNPGSDWFRTNVDTSGWKKGLSGFGSGDAPGGVIRTEWTSTDIWLRREYELPANAMADLQFYIQHDDDAEIYINGDLAAELDGANRFEPIEISRLARLALKPGKNVVAVHCKDTGGDQYIDLGFVTIRDSK